MEKNTNQEYKKAFDLIFRYRQELERVCLRKKSEGEEESSRLHLVIRTVDNVLEILSGLKTTEQLIKDYDNK